MVMKTKNPRIKRKIRIRKKIYGTATKPRLAVFKSNKNIYVQAIDDLGQSTIATASTLSSELKNQNLTVEISKKVGEKLGEALNEIGVKAVVLIGGGEPMAHPEFGNIIDYFYENDIHVGVTSNGTLINKYLDQLAYKTKWVRISVDAGSEEMFQKYRPHSSGKSQFNKVIEGMKSISKIKKTKLGYSFLVLEKKDNDRRPVSEGGNYVETNATDIFKAAELAKSIGCDYFEVKPSFDPFHFLNDTSNLTNIIKSQLDMCKPLEDSNFSIISPYTLKRTLEGENKQEKNYSRCLTAEMRTVLSPSGAYVCPYHRGNINLKIGDPNLESLKEIWYGKQREEIMNKLNPKKHCEFHCIRHNTNLELEKIDKILENSEFTNLNSIENFDRFI